MRKREILYLLPGLLCDERIWRHQVDALKDSLDIRIANFRGMDSFVSMAQAVLSDAPERFLVAGHSMGGRVAMQLLDLAPERIAGLALLDTAAHPTASGEREKRQRFVDIAEQQGMAALARAWAPPMVHPAGQQDAAFMQAIFDMVESYSVEEFKGQIRALLERADARPFLAHAPANTLVLCGREDAWSPWQQHQEFARLMPGNPPVRIIKDCGHMSTMEQPAHVADALRQWCDAR